VYVSSAPNKQTLVHSAAVSDTHPISQIIVRKD
jgi:hypothetical protein